MLLGPALPEEVASIALFSILRVSPTDMPTPAADSFEAAICCNDRANGSKTALAAGAAGVGFAAAAGLAAEATVVFRLAKEGSTFPGVGLIVVGNLPIGCVPGPRAAEEAAGLASLSDMDVVLTVDVEERALSVNDVGDVRLFFRLSTIYFRE